MPETGAIIASFFEGAGGAAAVAEGAGAVEAGAGAAAVGTAAGAAEVGTAAGVTGLASGADLTAAYAGMGVAGGETVAGLGAAGAAGAAGGSIMQTLGTQVASGVTSQLVSGLLRPDAAPINNAPPKSTAPNVPPPTAMPDPVAQEAARRKSIIEQLARRGRASTVLTQPAGSGSLGA